MSHWNIRTELLIGSERLEKLQNAHVLLVGLGGVGAVAAEMLARSGIGHLTIADGDTVDPSNRNRQLGALVSTHGLKKTDVMAARIRDINPDIQLTVVDEYLIDGKINQLLEPDYDYVIDAIDTLSPKLFFIKQAMSRGHRLISSMGAGSKTDPMQVRIAADVSETYICPLARYVRKRLRRMGIEGGFRAVFSPEEVHDKPIMLTDGNRNKRSIVGTISYLPNIFGCFCASVAIREIIGLPITTEKSPYSGIKKRSE
jgi:tRNA threonylcarbamoyladenosine dehydratase